METRVPALLDSVVVALIVIIVPIRAAAERRRLQTALASGAVDAKVSAYRRIMAWQWTAAIVLLGVWLGTGRALSLLGIEPPRGTGFVAGIVIAVVIVAVLVVQMLAAARPNVAEQIRAAVASLMYLLPSTPAELRLFTWLGVTAGIVEELLYRGYVMWVLLSVAPTWVALVASSIAFGIGHAYQGVAGIMKTSLVGLVLGALRVFTGSIWIPIVIHAAVDVLNGRTAYAAMKGKPVLGDA